MACLDGARSCPPEDCGGPRGHAELLQVVTDPRHPEHRDAVEWLRAAFDPEHFDAALATRRMRRAL